MYVPNKVLKIKLDVFLNDKLEGQVKFWALYLSITQGKKNRVTVAMCCDNKYKRPKMTKTLWLITSIIVSAQSLPFTSDGEIRSSFLI